MSAIAVVATELGFMSPDTFRNAIKQSVKEITKSLPETSGLIDTSAVRLVAADTDFFIDTKPDSIKETLNQVELKIDEKEALKSKKDQGKIVKIEPAITKTKDAYENEVMSSLESFIASRPLDGIGLMDLAEVRLTYYVDGSFSIESGIPVVASLALSVQEEVIIEAPPPDAIFAGVSG